MNDAERAPEVKQAARDTERRKREPTRSLEREEASSQHTALQLKHELKPLVVGAAVAAGALVVVGVALAVRRSRRARFVAPAQPSPLGALARNVGLGLLRLAARQAARAMVARFAATQSESSGSVAMPPDQVQR